MSTAKACVLIFALGWTAILVAQESTTASASETILPERDETVSATQSETDSPTAETLTGEAAMGAVMDEAPAAERSASSEASAQDSAANAETASATTTGTTAAAAETQAPDTVVPPQPESNAVAVPAAPAPSSAEAVPLARLVGSQAQAMDPGVIIDRFEFSYGLPHPDLPPLEELKDLTVPAALDGNVYRAPAAEGADNVMLSAVPAGARFDGDALRGIAQEVVRWYNNRGLNGVWVAYTDLESSATGVVDNRAADNQSAHLVIWASQIAEVRTLARGRRFRAEDSINHRKHRKIVRRSPLKAGATPEEPGSLFSRERLDDYLYGLSLHPGRRVEASIASAGQPGKVVLDYLINEARTWQVYSQFNNYGSDSTGRYRVRLGFQHNQLTNHDDMLSVDLISTPDFETTGSFLSYRIPLWRPARVVLRVYGSYGDFVATEGDPQLSLRYIGKNWLGGMEFSNRLSLWRDWQLMSTVGANFNHYGIQQKFGDRERPLVDAESDFLVPFLGTTLSRGFGWGALSGSVRFDHTLEGYANTNATTGIRALGRSEVDADWTSVKWNLNGTVYLDQLFAPSENPVLAHEVSVRVRGRVLLRGKRLIPHELEALGGAFSIRGYPESIVSADEFAAGSIEYAWHIPRALKPGDEGRFFRWPFKWRPKQAGQNPDWDLVLRAFYDYAYRGVNPPPSAANLEPDPDDPNGGLTFIDQSFGISGAGVGLSLLVKQNFSLRLDYGVALTKLQDIDREQDEQIIVPKGNKEFYLVTNFSW